MTEKKPYDPKLREAALEFEALCKKYDCMGSALFSSPTHSEYINYFQTSWSVISLESPTQLRLRSKLEDFGGDKAAQKKATESTLHALTSLVEWSRKTHEAYQSVIHQVGKHMRILWKTWDTPDSIPGDGK